MRMRTLKKSYLNKHIQHVFTDRQINKREFLPVIYLHPRNRNLLPSDRHPIIVEHKDIFDKAVQDNLDVITVFAFVSEAPKLQGRKCICKSKNLH